MRHIDPYPQIPPALLNSGDIRAYAEHPDVKFVSPFVVDRLKSASYHVPCEGTVYAWETIEGAIPDIRKIQFDLVSGETFKIKPNSIVYLFTSTQFKLPSYLAIRFNLTISKVHQGLLLGTGPLVDPGYEGRLLIPLHNLTNQEVVLHADDMLIWVEVTKLSPDQTQLIAPAHQFPLVPFPETKKNLPAINYFRQANQGRPVLSSVQLTLDESKVLLKSLKDRLGESQRRIEEAAAKRSLWTIVGTVLAAVALVYPIVQIAQSAHSKYDSLSLSYLQQKEELEKYKMELATLKEEMILLMRKNESTKPQMPIAQK